MNYWEEWGYDSEEEMFDDEEEEAAQGGCYIATSVYGSYDCPEVWILRRFRDYKLSKTILGRAFIKVYYALSPTLVSLLGNTSLFKKFWRNTLDKIILRLRAQGFEDTPYKDR